MCDKYLEHVPVNNYCTKKFITSLSNSSKSRFNLKLQDGVFTVQSIQQIQLINGGKYLDFFFNLYKTKYKQIDL